MFRLEDVAASRSNRYRELDMGAAMLGFPSVDAYATLEMTDQAEPTGVRSILTFAAGDPTQVDALTARPARA